MYHNPQAIAQVNRNAWWLSQSSIQSGRVAPVFFSLSTLWSPCSIDLGMRRHVQPCMVSFLLVLFWQRYLHMLMISLSVSCCLDIKAAKKMVARYEQIAEAKINFDKSKGLWLGAWRGGNFLPGSIS